MTNTLAKILLITEVTELIAQKHSIRLEEARNKLYKSRIIDLIDDDELALYGESPLYVFSLYEMEMKKAKTFNKTKF